MKLNKFRCQRRKPTYTGPSHDLEKDTTYQTDLDTAKDVRWNSSKTANAELKSDLETAEGIFDNAEATAHHEYRDEVADARADYQTALAAVGQPFDLDAELKAIGIQAKIVESMYLKELANIEVWYTTKMAEHSPAGGGTPVIGDRRQRTNERDRRDRTRPINLPGRCLNGPGSSDCRVRPASGEQAS